MENSNSTPQQNPAPEETKTTSRIMTKSFAVICLLILLVLLLGGYFVVNEASRSKVVAPTTTPQAVITTASPSASPLSSATPAKNSMLDKTYTSAEAHWQLDYPSDLKVQTFPADQSGPDGVSSVINFSKLGPTQGENTEFHDGLSFSVGLMKKDPSQSIEKFADDHTQIMPDVGSKTSPKAIEVNGLTGVEITTSGLGEVRNVFFKHPSQADRVYSISIFSDGPGTRNAEYDAIVEEMLKSFRDTN